MVKIDLPYQAASFLMISIQPGTLLSWQSFGEWERMRGGGWGKRKGDRDREEMRMRGKAGVTRGGGGGGGFIPTAGESFSLLLFYPVREWLGFRSWSYQGGMFSLDCGWMGGWMDGWDKKMARDTKPFVLSMLSPVLLEVSKICYEGFRVLRRSLQYTWSLVNLAGLTREKVTTEEKKTFEKRRPRREVEGTGKGDFNRLSWSERGGKERYEVGGRKSEGGYRTFKNEWDQESSLTVDKKEKDVQRRRIHSQQLDVSPLLRPSISKRDFNSGYRN